MCEKYIKRKEVYTVIKNIIKDNSVSTNINDLIVTKDQLEKIQKSLSGKKYKYKSDILRIIRRDCRFKAFYNSECSGNSIHSNTLSGKSVNLKQLLNVFNENHDKVCPTWRCSTSIYKDLCEGLKMKNNLRNRKKVFNMWRKLPKSSINIPAKELFIKIENIYLRQSVSDGITQKTFSDLNEYEQISRLSESIYDISEKIS
ncbi:hypothetical protein JTB14_016426 [Gonioctena quinquepunctata]|nr:hypothetical protein JTB14_016426 [Gonioctena quinquepunctata]